MLREGCITEEEREIAYELFCEQNNTKDDVSCPLDILDPITYNRDRRQLINAEVLEQQNWQESENINQLNNTAVQAHNMTLEMERRVMTDVQADLDAEYQRVMAHYQANSNPNVVLPSQPVSLVAQRREITWMP